MAVLFSYGFLLVKTQRMKAPSSDLSVVVPPEVVKNGILAYNQLVMSLFSEKRVPAMVVSFAKMAVECMSLEDKDAKQQVESLRRTIFNNSLEVCEFDEAYASLASLSDKDS